MLDESAGKDSEVFGHVVQEWARGNRLAVQQREASGALSDSERNCSIGFIESSHTWCDG